MLEQKGASFNKILAFLLVGVLMVGVLIFWIATFDFKSKEENKVIEQGLNLKGFLEQDETLQKTRENLSEAKDQFTSREDGGQIIKEIEVGETQEKQGLVLSLLDIIFKEGETWVYLALENKNPARVLFRASSQDRIRIIQSEREFPEIHTEKLVDYPLPDIIDAQEEILGTLHFTALDPEETLILFISGVKLEGMEEHFNFVFKIIP